MTTMPVKNLYLALSAVLLIHVNASAQRKTVSQRVDSVLKLMTLEEKAGQLNQYSGDWSHTGPITKDGDKPAQIRNGQLGSMLNVIGVQHTREVQEMAMQSRLKIPLLFGQDVIHGFRTTFPIPLAEAASWDLPAIERSARVAAEEASASGIHWTFAPMVDIARDARWGRVMEGSGEDPYLGSLIAAARVKGFQGKGIGRTDAVMACVKHFAAYGAATGGRDYNSVDMSERMLWSVYLPPFKAALDAGASSIMNAFNDLNGIPATGNRYLLRDVLKGQWNFKGIVVSDWGSVNGMVKHGYAADNKEAALDAITAGCDMDMESRCYKDYLVQLVKEGKVNMSLVDDAVRRVLTKKFELGLFDDPFKFCDEAREAAQKNVPAHREAARDIARKSIVLLKNEQQVLPISKKIKTIALIGPFMKAMKDNLGFWSMEWPDDSSTIVTQYEGIRQRLDPSSTIRYAKGCNINDSIRTGFAEAIAAAQQADVVIMSIGEARDMSGESKSRSNITIPGVQEELVQAIIATGKPVVVMINAGRPQVFNRIADEAPSVLYTWWLGSQAGNAIADVLFGDYNPSGRLPVSFPRSTGQMPIYYNHFNTGHPAASDKDVNYVTGYIDLQNSPRFPFGYGLGYSAFVYGDVQLDKNSMPANSSIKANITVTNSGKYDGTETVQLYIRDMAASAIRPVKELKKFQQVFLKAGETKTVSFSLTAEDLKFYNNRLQYVYEPGAFTIMIGPNARDVKEKMFQLIK
jgi:beta-glucosidase